MATTADLRSVAERRLGLSPSGEINWLTLIDNLKLLFEHLAVDCGQWIWDKSASKAARRSKPMLTTEKLEIGNFKVLWNGNDSGWRIVNGSVGLSGKDTRNHYGVTKGKEITWIGSIASCKAILTQRLKKNKDK